MFATALIVFREVLEAALIVGIVAAATRGIAGRARWIAAGIASGVLGSLAVAGGAGYLSQLAEGMGQELFNATILGIAVAMLAWHNIWMSVHGRELPYRLALIPFNSPWSLAGVPAASIPCGFVDRLPVGLALVGPRLGEATVLRAAHAFQQATGWHECRPAG